MGYSQEIHVHPVQGEICQQDSSRLLDYRTISKEDVSTDEEYNLINLGMSMTRNQAPQEAERMREVWRYVFTQEWLKQKKPTHKGEEDSISSAGTRGKYTLSQAVDRCAVFVESRDWELLARKNVQKGGV